MSRPLTVPHPANFALHKLIIAQRRSRQEKAIKDKNMAREILSALIKKGEQSNIRKVFHSLIPNWQREVLSNLHPVEDEETLLVLKK